MRYAGCFVCFWMFRLMLVCFIVWLARLFVYFVCSVCLLDFDVSVCCVGCLIMLVLFSDWCFGCYV